MRNYTAPVIKSTRTTIKSTSKTDNNLNNKRLNDKNNASSTGLVSRDKNSQTSANVATTNSSRPNSTISEDFEEIEEEEVEEEEEEVDDDDDVGDEDEFEESVIVSSSGDDEEQNNHTHIINNRKDLDTITEETSSKMSTTKTKGATSSKMAHTDFKDEDDDGLNI